MTATVEHDRKMLFAALLQRVPRNQRYSYAVQVAKQVMGREECEQFPMFIIRIAEEWPFDLEVITEIDRLDYTPKTLEQLLVDTNEIIEDKHASHKDKNNAIVTYARLRGYLKELEAKAVSNPNEYISSIQGLDKAISNPVDT